MLSSFQQRFGCLDELYSKSFRCDGYNEIPNRLSAVKSLKVSAAGAGGGAEGNLYRNHFYTPKRSHPRVYIDTHTRKASSTLISNINCSAVFNVLCIFIYVMFRRCNLQVTNIYFSLISPRAGQRYGCVLRLKQ